MSKLEIKSTSKGVNLPIKHYDMDLDTLLIQYTALSVLLKQLSLSMRRFMLEIVNQSVADAVNQLALHTPPRKGEKPFKRNTKVGQKLFYRKTKYLPKWVNSPQNDQKQKDISELRKGNIYKIKYVNSTNYQNPQSRYFKKMGKRKLNDTRLIKNRYLARIMWGYNLKELGMKQALAVKQAIAANRNKSALTKYASLNQINIVRDRYTTAVKITNHAIQDGGWMKNARYLANKKASEKQRRFTKKYMKKLSQQVIENSYKEWSKYASKYN